MTEVKYPMAEVFDSIKGEGLYTGVAMRFWRFAGCNVGKPLAPLNTSELNPTPPLVGPYLTEKSDAWVCHTYDNRPFYCDTDFHKYEEKSIEELLDGCWQERIVITGGEPLIHMFKLQPLLEAARLKGKRLHLETSGTIDWTTHLQFDFVACAPKAGYKVGLGGWINEFKLLVDKDFNLSTIPIDVLRHERVYLQPVNPPYGLDKENMQRCFDLQKQFPKWIFSPQLHKLLGVK